MNAQTFQYPSPQTTLVILLGASEWPRDTHFPAHQAFKVAAEKMYQYFVQSFAIPPGNILQLFDTELNASEIDEEIHNYLASFQGKARDVIVYYVGRGEQTSSNQLYLAIRKTRHDNPEGTSLQITSIAKTILGQAYSMRRFYILDCKVAARAIYGIQGVSTTSLMFGAIEEAERGMHGYTGLFSSGLVDNSGLDDPSILPDGTNTFFTEALLRVLADGNSDPYRPLSFYEIHEAIDKTALHLYQKYLPTYPSLQKPPKVQMYSGDIKDIHILPKSLPSSQHILLPSPITPGKVRGPSRRPRLLTLSLVVLLLIVVILASFLHVHTSGKASISNAQTRITPPSTHTLPANFTVFSNSSFSLDYPRDWTHKQNNNKFSFARSDNVTEFIVSINNNAPSSNATINALTGDILSCTQQNAQPFSSVVVNNRVWRQSIWNCFLASTYYVVHLLTSVNKQIHNGTAILYAGWQQVLSSKLINFDQANTQDFQPMLQSLTLK